MEQGQKLKLSGGSVSGLTSSTILYGLGGNVVDLDFNKIRYNKLYSVYPLNLDNSVSRTSLEEGSNVLSIDLSQYYKKDEVNSNISNNKDIYNTPFRSNLLTNEITNHTICIRAVAVAATAASEAALALALALAVRACTITNEESNIRHASAMLVNDVDKIKIK